MATVFSDVAWCDYAIKLFIFKLHIFTYFSLSLYISAFIYLITFIFLKIYLFIYLFSAVLGLRFCVRAFSSCGKRWPLFIAVRGPPTVAASLVAEHKLQAQAQ